MQTVSSSSETIINQGSEILSYIRSQPIQKHFTNILCCNIESFNIFLLQNPWIRSNLSDEHIPKVFSSVLQFLSLLKESLGELIRTKFFEEIGLNYKYKQTITNMIASFEKIINSFKQTSIFQQLQDEDLNFRNLEHELKFIDQTSENLKEKYKNYKSLIRQSNNFNPGELSIIFDLSNMANDECTISWQVFSQKLTIFIYDLEKIELMPNQLAQIRKMVDCLKVSAISFDNLNYFFNYLWIKGSERKGILNPHEIAPKNLGESMASVIMDEFPLLILTMKETHVIRIHPRGYDHPSNPNFRGDGITYFGRRAQTSANLNDVNMNEGDLTVSRRQFQIVYLEEKKSYVLICISNSNPTMFKINRRMRLKLGSLFQLSESQFFKVESIGYKKEKNPAQYLKTPDEVKKKFDNEMSKQGQAARKALENKIDVLAESMYFSVLGLQPPDLENTTDNTFNKRTVITKKSDLTAERTAERIKFRSQPMSTTQEDPSSAPFIELSFIKGQNQNAKRRLTVTNPTNSQVFSIGRKSDNDIVVDSQDLSAIHCQIMFDAVKDAWYLGEKLIKIQEKDSFNGTYLFLKDFNEFTMKKPSQAKKLKEGMIIRVGSNEISVHFEEGD